MLLVSKESGLFKFVSGEVGRPLTSEGHLLQEGKSAVVCGVFCQVM